jgi:hypothetical protein
MNPYECRGRDLYALVQALTGAPPVSWWTLSPEAKQGWATAAKRTRQYEADAVALGDEPNRPLNDYVLNGLDHDAVNTAWTAITTEPEPQP